MRGFSFFLLIIFSILFLQANSGCQEQAQEEVDATIYPTEYVSGEIIVKFKPEAFDDEGELVSESIQTLNDKYGLVSMEPVFKGKPSSNLAYIYKLTFPVGVDIMQAVQEYSEDPSVIYAEPNYIMHAVEKDQDAD